MIGLDTNVLARYYVRDVRRETSEIRRQYMQWAMWSEQRGMLTTAIGFSPSVVARSREMQYVSRWRVGAVTME